MATGKKVFGRFEDKLDDRDVEILKQLFIYQEEHGKGPTFNKFEKLLKKNSKMSMARQTLTNHIGKLIEMGLMEKICDETSKLNFQPTVLSLTNRGWKSLSKIQSNELQKFIMDFRKIEMEGGNIQEIAENIVNVSILSLGRLFKQCILTEDPYQRTILFNVTYDLIKQVFEYAISNAESDERIKSKILEVIESTFKHYTEKYEIEL